MRLFSTKKFGGEKKVKIEAGRMRFYKKGKLLIFYNLAVLKIYILKNWTFVEKAEIVLTICSFTKWLVWPQQTIYQQTIFTKN